MLIWFIWNISISLTYSEIFSKLFNTQFNGSGTCDIAGISGDGGNKSLLRNGRRNNASAFPSSAVFLYLMSL